MYDGEQFRREWEQAAEEIGDTAKWLDPAAAAAMRRWANAGGGLIDHPDTARAVRYLLASIGVLAERNAIVAQTVMGRCTGRMLTPLWIAAAALVWIAVRR